MVFSDFEQTGIIKYNFMLATVTSMKTGGNAKYAFFPRTAEELRSVILFLRNEDIKYCVIGYASNVLFPDEGYDGAVVFTSEMKAVSEEVDGSILDTLGIKADDRVLFYAQAGVSLTSFAFRTLKKGYAGLEFAYGIPASVGGAIFMNAGAYGGEISDCLLAVEFLDANGEISYLYNSPDKKLFSYRHSPFSNSPDKIIIGGIFALSKASGDESMNKALANMSSRKTKQPLEYPSCGSAFKRPEGYYAGALIEGAGLKGYSIGGACVSEKHAGFIINKGGATTNDVLALIKHIRDTVYAKDGVMLEPEIRTVE